MKKSSRKFFLFLTLTLTLTLSVRSDDFFKVKDRIIEESRFKLGFLYITPLLMLENVGYTSDVYTYEEKDRPDWTGDLGFGLRASSIAANRLILQAEDMPLYSFYLKNENLRSWSNRFAAKAYSYIGPFNFKAGFKRNDLQQRPQLEFSRPYQYTDREWSGEIDIGRRWDLFLTVYASFSELSYEDDPYLENYNLAEKLNHRQNVFGVELNKPVFTSTILFAKYERVDYEFESSSERDTRAHQVALGIEFPEIGNLQGSFQIGIRRFVPANPLFRSVQNANGSGNVHLTLADRLRFNAFYELGTSFSYTSADLHYNHNTFGGGVEAYLTRFLKGGASFQDGRMKYHSFLDFESQRNDRVRQQRYYLAFPFIGKTSIGLAYNIYRLTSDALGLDYTRNFWGGFISYEF